MYHNRCVSFSASKKNFNATNNKNVHQNPAIVICEEVSISAYLLGSKIARFNAAIGFIHHMMATIINGKSILIPNTAMTIPRVRNLFCRFDVILLKTVALTTALSNDNDTSNIHNISTMNIVCIQFII